MSVTVIGLLQAGLGLWIVLRGTLNQALWFLLLSGLMGGSASAYVGASSIQPMQFALLFVLLRVLMPRGGYAGAVPEALRENLSLLLFAGYGIAAAMIAPRIFAGQINVTPMRADMLRSLFDAFPLAPSPQNFTAAVYLAGTLISAIVSYVIVRYRGGAEALVRASLVLIWIHGLSGIVGIIVRGTPLDAIFNFFRNASYAQVDQSYQGFVRMNGIFPEPSSYADFAFAWFVFACECWLRDILPRKTGRAALFMALVLFFSTSSTAYVGLAIYVAFLYLRIATFPNPTNRAKAFEAGMAFFAAIFMGCVALALVPSLPAAIFDMVLHMTVDKQDSESGQQRYFWAVQGLDAFVVSFGLGIGPGSFRSSSIVTAIIGSMGVVGVLSFIAYLWKVVQPSRMSTWCASDNMTLAIGGAAACAALFKLVPASVGSPSPDPGASFAVFAGAALALRRSASLAPVQVRGAEAGGARAAGGYARNGI